MSGPAPRSLFVSSTAWSLIVLGVLSDLASCLSKMRYASGDYDFEAMRRFMDAYRAVYPIDRDEWRWFPDALRYRQLARDHWSRHQEMQTSVIELLDRALKSNPH